MAILIIIRIGIVEFVPKENDDEIDEYPDLNIYEKIQILFYENKYLKKNECYSPINEKLIDNDKTKTKPIPIPNNIISTLFPF
jgi:hypothetical protein